MQIRGLTKIRHLGFKVAVAILFAVLLATYGVYWLAISALHDHTNKLVVTSNHLQQGETFHSAIHSMLMDAEGFRLSGERAVFRLRYQRDLARASRSLPGLRESYGLLVAAGDDGGVNQLTKGMAREFAKFRQELEAVFRQSGSQGQIHLREAERRFNRIFQKYYLQLHDHHKNQQKQLRQSTDNTWRAMTTVFAIQLVLAVIAGVLVIVYLDRVVLKIFFFTERMAYRDQLTGLHNRAVLDKWIASQDQEGREDRRRYAVIMLDIDYFKRFNDTHGHQAGDKLLADLAAVLVQSVRSQDRVIRYGGEEFLVHLSETDARDALTVAEKLRQAIENHSFRLPDGGPAPRVTASLGVAGFPADGNNFQETVQKADQRLYAAKALGRNRVVAEDMALEPAVEDRPREIWD